MSAKKKEADDFESFNRTRKTFRGAPAGFQMAITFKEEFPLGIR
jgi:hypothetical protein